MDLSKLKTPFQESDIEWRVQRSGIKNGKPWAFVLAYVTNRAIMERLDDVCSPECWKNEFTTGPDGGVLCGVSINVGNEWVTKYDGADNTNIEAVKGGLSGAMKRAAVQWGIGRYLYKLDANYATFSTNGKYSAKIENQWFKWDAPELPAFALPSDTVTNEAEQLCKKIIEYVQVNQKYISKEQFDYCLHIRDHGKGVDFLQTVYDKAVEEVNKKVEHEAKPQDEKQQLDIF